jgi:hypothetical protein
VHVQADLMAYLVGVASLLSPSSSPSSLLPFGLGDIVDEGVAMNSNATSSTLAAGTRMGPAVGVV